MPRQCRLCGNWFLHEQGDKTVYYERGAPDETEQACREIGAWTAFEKKIQEEFKVWAVKAAVERDAAIEEMDSTTDVALRTWLVEQLKEKLNDR